MAGSGLELTIDLTQFFARFGAYLAVILTCAIILILTVKIITS